MTCKLVEATRAERRERGEEWLALEERSFGKRRSRRWFEEKERNGARCNFDSPSEEASRCSLPGDWLEKISRFLGSLSKRRGSTEDLLTGKR